MPCALGIYARKTEVWLCQWEKRDWSTANQSLKEQRGSELEGGYLSSAPLIPRLWGTGQAVGRKTACQASQTHGHRDKASRDGFLTVRTWRGKKACVKRNHKAEDAKEKKEPLTSGQTTWTWGQDCGVSFTGFCRGRFHSTEGHSHIRKISSSIYPRILPKHRLFQRHMQTYSKCNHNLKLESGKFLNKSSARKHWNHLTTGLSLNIYYKHGYTMHKRYQ